MSGAQSEADVEAGEVTPRRARWPWIIGIAAGLVGAFVTYVVVLWWAHFDSGGTLGGFGASATDTVDWGHHATDIANNLWVPVLVAFATPIAWAASTWRRSRGSASERRALVVLAGLVVVAVATAAAPAVSGALDRSRALEPARQVVALLERSADGDVDRLATKLTEDGPWVVLYEAHLELEGPFVDVGGTWYCSSGGVPMWFATDTGEVTRVDVEEGTAWRQPPSVLDPSFEAADQC